MTQSVFDASALMMFLNREPGWEHACDLLLSGAKISAVNHAEIIGKATDSGAQESVIRSIMSTLEIEVIPFDEHQAWLAGLLRPETRHLGLSFADRACLALGLQLQAKVITCDRPWTQLNIGISIECIRP